MLIDAPTSRLGNRGEPVRPQVKTMLSRSYVQYAMHFSNEHPLCEMLPDFFVYLGGVDQLCRVQEKVHAEFLELHFDLPVKESDESQEGYFSTTNIADVFQLKASISLGFF